MLGVVLDEERALLDRLESAERTCSSAWRRSVLCERSWVSAFDASSDESLSCSLIEKVISSIYFIKSKVSKIVS